MGTSKKIHKVFAVYWTLLNIPPEFRSSLTSINLGLLCLTQHVQNPKYGYQEVLKPLMKDLVTLEEKGVFISQLQQNVKGFVIFVSADNLAAHSLAGFIESFSGRHVCRFCTGARNEFQSKEVRSGVFPLRTKQEHARHIQAVQSDTTINNYFGVKKGCVFTAHLSSFHVLTGYPPDILHDLFEGIVPVELALCLGVFTSKHFLNLDVLNKLIKEFPFKWADKTDCPKPVPKKYLSSRSIGGNAHENWTLIRLLPFIIGSKVPNGDPAWELLMNLKDIVELCVASVHTEESIAYLDFKISEHRQQFLQLFPDTNLLPKHHYVEHYPQLIRCYGPLVFLWTMRYEAKHSFFKQVARFTNCFRNILLTLAGKHQFMMAYHMYSSSLVKNGLCVSNVSTVPVNVMKDDIEITIKRKYPNVQFVQLTDKASLYGTHYVTGMILVHGSTGGLPDFGEILHIVIIESKLNFILKPLNAWYNEHFRSFELHKSSTVVTVALVSHDELGDFYPLAAYRVNGKRMVTLKRYINCK